MACRIVKKSFFNKLVYFLLFVCGLKIKHNRGMAKHQNGTTKQRTENNLFLIPYLHIVMIYLINREKKRNYLLLFERERCVLSY